MHTELTLLIPDSLLFQLERKARERGESIDSFCLSLLSGSEKKESLIDPSFYRSLGCAELRNELTKVIKSSLPSQEMKIRVKNLEFEISRRYK